MLCSFVGSEPPIELLRLCSYLNITRTPPDDQDRRCHQYLEGRPTEIIAQGWLHTTDLTIDYLPLGALKPYARNARTHSRKQVRQIADSIRTFGFTSPLLIDASNMILAGHGRLAAAQVLGMDAVPCVRLEAMTPAQKKA